MATPSTLLLRTSLAWTLLCVQGALAEPDGEPDPTFFGAGRYVASAAPDSLFAFDVLPTADGSAVLWVGAQTAASSNTRSARIARVADEGAQGHFDLVLASGAGSHFETMARDASGRVLAEGATDSIGNGQRLLVTRFLPDGLTLDPSFDGDGVLLMDLPAPPTNPQGVASVAAQGDHVIVLANYGPEPTDLAASVSVVGRLLPDGTLDPSFGAGGWTQLTQVSRDRFETLAVHPDGRIYVGGYGASAAGGNTDFQLYALDENGLPRTDFGDQGLLRFGFGATSDDYAVDTALMPDGRIVMVGVHYRDIQPSEVGAVAMIRADGVLDSTFGTNGRLITLGLSLLYDVVAQGDGSVLVSGHTWAPSDGVRILRANPAGVWDPTWNANAAFLAFPEGEFDQPLGLTLHSGRVVTVVSLLNTPPEVTPVGLGRLQNSFVFADGFEIGSAALWSLP